jgi:hypothetical protein
MSCFLLPQEIYDKIESAICHFWWGSQGDNKKIHWVKKDKLMRSTTEEGLGFRCLRDFNLAMLGTKVWRLHIDPDTLISKVFKARYYPNNDIHKANVGSSPSYVWRSMYQSIWVLNKGCCWQVGNGHTINIWEDRWL